MSVKYWTYQEWTQAGVNAPLFFVASSDYDALAARLAALELAAWDVHEVIGDALDGDAYMDDVSNAWNELGELLPAKRPADSAPAQENEGL